MIGEYLLLKLAPISDPYEKWKYVMTPNQYIKSEHPPNLSIKTVVESGLPGMYGNNNFSTNNMGFRGDILLVPKPNNEYRIFMIGGSTTENFYLSDSLNISSILQDYLQENMGTNRLVKVYNAGKSGDAIDDHISMLVHRIIHLEPDMIITFCGINDLSRSIVGYDYLHYFNKYIVKTPLVKGFATEFQIPRRLYYLIKNVAPKNQDILEKVTYRSNFVKKVKLTKSMHVIDERPRIDIESYKNNLISMIGLTKSHKIELIFMTQQTTWNSTVDENTVNWHWMTLRAGKKYREDHLDNALDSLNNVMKQVSVDHSIPLYDVAQRIPKSLKYFFDDAHFNIEGASTLGKDLGKYILQNNLIGLN